MEGESDKLSSLGGVMSANASTVKTNWASLKEAIQTNVENMGQAAGEKIVEVRLPSDYEMTLVHKKTFKGLNLTLMEGMDSLRVENSAGVVNLTKIPDFVGSLAVDLLQALS
jgi:hypothetical protein